MPMFDPDKTYELHGAGRIPFPEPLDYPGGIFGGPVMPIERAGIFEAHWALPSDMTHDVTIAGPLFSPRVPADYAIRPSGAPIMGLAGLGANGEGGIFSALSSAAGGAGIGATVGALTAPKSKRGAGAVIGALAGLAGQAVGASVFRPPLLALALAAVGGWAGAKVAAGMKKG